MLLCDSHIEHHDKLALEISHVDGVQILTPTSLTHINQDKVTSLGLYTFIRRMEMIVVPLPDDCRVFSIHPL